MERYDLDWIIILFFIYLNLFRVEKNGGIDLQGHFSGRSQFGKLGSETFRGHFKASNDIFGVKNFLVYFGPHYTILHIDTFPTVEKSRQSELVCKIYVSHNSTCHVDHHYMRGCC
jgi:hypothetical protein